ncbi:MAG: TPM domain-containing protein, partial [Candidatus Sericytochromatia bacterium]|nr:TPM domain-containing protein [Candidatus Tanganyikabacteria bacterium]
MGTVLCLLAAAVAYSVGDVANPRSRGSWIADEAGVIPEAAEVELNRRIDSLDRDLGVEIAVVTVPEVDTTPKEFATALFNRWGVGKRRADNGLLVLLVRDRRRLEMETGYGLEPILPDGWLGGMQQKKMVPRFKAGDFGGGLVAGVEAVESKLREAPAEAAEGTRREGDPPPAAGGSDAGLLALG